MSSGIIRDVSDADASFGSFLKAHSRIGVEEKKWIIPVDLQQMRLQDR